MKTEPREPSRLPARGTIAAAGTVGALAVLLSMPGGPLAPDEPVPAAAAELDVPDELMAVAPTETSGAEAVVEPMTVSGERVPTRWGDVQVEVTIDGSNITQVVALVMPDGDDHSATISEYVEPILREEAIATDTADISVISGATYTVRAYAQSLQSALDEADARAEADPPTEAHPTAQPERVAEAEAEVGAEEPAAAVAADPDAGEIRTASGDAVAIRWGDVQVAVTVQGDDIIDVRTLAVPDDSRSRRINSRAEPVLREEAIATDSADVSVVSGATYTSRAYAASLQSALDQLGV